MKLGDFSAAGTVDDVGVERIGSDVAVLDGADRMPVAIGDLAIVATARDADRAALLLSGADPIGEGGRGAHVVELRRRLIQPAAPGLTAVHGDVGSLIAHERN